MGGVTRGAGRPDGWKRCSVCKEFKPRSEFYRNKGWRDGLHPYCKKCLLAYQRKRFLARPNLPDRRWARSVGLRENYFSEIDTPVKAYVLGLFAADGNIGPPTAINRLSIELSRRDISLLRLVRSELCPRARIGTRRRKGHVYVTFGVSSARLRTDLKRLGVVPRKSGILRWPRRLPSQFAWAFLLGYFDGDGWITLVRKKPRRYWRWGLLGTRAFLHVARDVIFENTGVLFTPPLPRTGIWILQKVGRDVVVLDEWVHQIEGLGLRRKRISLRPGMRR